MEQPEPFDQTTTQVAATLGVTAQTVASWADSGLLPHWKTVGKHRRFRRSDVERFRDEQMRGDAA